MNTANPFVARPSFAYNHLSLGRQLQIVGQVLEKCRSSAALLPGDPFVAALRESTDDLRRTELAVATLKKQLSAAIAVRRDSEIGFHRQCLAFLGHIAAIAPGDPVVITDAGLPAYTPVRRVATPMTTPMTLRAVGGVHPGEVHLSWRKVRAARSYVIERCGGPSAAFAQVSISAGRRATLRDQPSAARLHYRVAAVGPLGPGPFSDDVDVVLR